MNWHVVFSEGEEDSGKAVDTCDRAPRRDRCGAEFCWGCGWAGVKAKVKVNCLFGQRSEDRPGVNVPLY